MRFHKPTTQFYCGVDLHARTMYICVIDREGNILKHRPVPCHASEFLRAVKPYRDDLTVACECIYAWYWLADLCHEEGIQFVLGHALYMRAIHGSKTKNDRIDSEKIARLTQSGLMPMAYVYPKEQRGFRDLLRRRLRFVRQRAELYTHTQHLNTQAHLPSFGQMLKSKPKRRSVLKTFKDQEVRMSVEANMDTIDHLDRVIARLEKHILKRAKDCYKRELRILNTIPGVGPIIALTILFEMDTVDRFPTRQQFASYCRLVKCPKESAGKRSGGSNGRKIGNSYLKWAFSEAAVFIAEYNETADKYLKRLERKHGKGRAKSLLAHKLGRVVYHMLTKGTAFDEAKFLNL